MNNTTTLLNFNIPIHLKEDFDELMKFKNITKTSVLNQFIEQYIRTEFRLLDKDGKFKFLIQNTKLKERLKKPKILNEYKSFNKPIPTLKSDDDLDDKKTNIPHLTNYLDDDYDWEKDRFGW